MKKIVAFVGLISIALFSATAFAQTAVHAVKFHADWCGSCKTIAPQLEKARGKHALDDLNVLFVTLDLTNETTRNQSAMMANAMGIGELYKENNGKTGYIVLINSKTGESLGKITKKHNADDIAALIKEKVKEV